MLFQSHSARTGFWWGCTESLFNLIFGLKTVKLKHLTLGLDPDSEFQQISYRVFSAPPSVLLAKHRARSVQMAGFTAGADSHFCLLE